MDEKYWASQRVNNLFLKSYCQESEYEKQNKVDMSKLSVIRDLEL